MSVFFWVGVFLLLGLGYREEISLLFATTVVFMAMIWDMIHQRKFVLPKLLPEYLVFLALFLVSIWWSRDQGKSFLHWLLFASLPFIWILASTHVSWLKRHFFGIFLTLGLLFAAMTVLSQTTSVFSFVKTTPRGLVGAYSVSANHFMLGDFWGVLLILLIYRYFHTKKIWLLPFISLGMSILLFSLSRSALVGFGVALAVLFSRSPAIDIKWKKVFWVFVIIATLYMNTQKSLLFNRPYYIQAIAGFFHYPFGVGVANFDIISSDPRFHLLGLSGFSRVTHSIFLEFIAGMGLLGFYFWWWCGRIYTIYFKNVKLSEYSLALIALVVDFIFNPTYFVAPMWWLFGVLLSLTANENYQGNRRVVDGALLMTAILVLTGGLLILTVST